MMKASASASGMSPEAQAIISESPTLAAFESQGHSGVGHGRINTVAIIGAGRAPPPVPPV